MRGLRIPVVLTLLLVSVAVPSCGGDDPTNPLTGCISLDRAPGGVQNNDPGVLIVHGTFPDGTRLGLTLDQNGVIVGNGLPMFGTKFKLGNDDWMRFNNIPKGTYNATWYASCDATSSPTHVDGPSTIVISN